MLNQPEYRIPREEKVKISPAKPTTTPWGERSVCLNNQLLVTENPNLKYLHYVNGEGDKKNFEMYLSYEARELAHKLGWQKVRQLFEDNIGLITNDPFGERSIDPSRQEKEAQIRRSINPITDELEQILEVPIAIKGTGIRLQPGHPDREDLRSQYTLMRYLQLKSQHVLTPEQKAVLEFTPVYGVIKYPVDRPERFQEWLIMRRYDDAERVEDHKLFLPWLGQYLGFDREEHSRLAQAFSVNSGSWNDLLWRFRGSGLEVSDISGRNLLCFKTDDEQQRYAVIDQKD